MNTRKRSDVTERDIQAYIDGQIEPGTEYAMAVEAHIAAEPGVRARVRAYERQNEAIRARYRYILAESIPERLAPDTLRADRMKPIRANVPTPIRFAAGIAGLGCAALIGWLAGQSSDTPLERFADRTAAYLTEDQGSTTPDDKVLLQSVAALGGTPDFAPEGLNLVGARRVDNGDMYEARYEDASGRELRLFVAPDPQRHNELLYRTQENGRKAVYWQQGPLMYALTGDFSEQDLDGLATTAIERLDDRLAGRRFADTERKGVSPDYPDEPIFAEEDIVAPDINNLQASQSVLEGDLGRASGNGNADSTPEVNRELQMDYPLPQ